MLIAFAACLALGYTVPSTIPNLFKNYWIAAYALTACATAIAALFFPMPPRIAQPAISILGLLKGLDKHADSLDLSSRLMTVTATILTVTLLLLFAGSVGPYALPRPRRILFRVVATSIAAVRMMIFAFAFRA